ncbi:MAG: hypothetical protein A2Z99_02205 [Treponema sp. GWB1_62_6]|nr:MAG: hypothetical protein A2Y36_10190 [Treponema sp. GWA1_62_8]OHE65282.1 MAG: hypothetical protein A2001_03480 [Treponema sp. GWC1_61_84]OHE69685.1 MAG: hypothetical protein A2Z99_02205 [Treponema sp. GWB1_62_6]OHE75198.1 MAG: hypothetical protein A2413_19775 [Treponema sp. RIFOXYC1_FULL_61_9]HCM28893.1 hypothetical protein [Treponema sp.]
MVESDNRAYLTMAELIAMAIAFEQDSAEFYAGMVKTGGREEVRDLLGQLRAEELSHAGLLAKITVTQDEARIQFPPSFRLTPFALPGGDPTFDDMLDLAIDREVQSVRLYRNAASLSSGTIARLMEDLSKFEALHEHMLREMRNR